MKKIILLTLCVITIQFCTSAQLFITENAKITVKADGLIKVDGNLEIQSGGELESSGTAVNIAADFIQNGSLTHIDGKIQMVGDGTQTLSGDLSNGNSINDLCINQQSNSAETELQTNVELVNTLEFIQGKIVTNANELYVKNDDPNAVFGHYPPNVADGTYPSNDRFVDGKLSRDINSGSTGYLFPVGNSTDAYNPVQIENMSGGTGKLTVDFTTEAIGPIDFEGTVDCSGSQPYSGSAGSVEQSFDQNEPVILKDMTGEGFWQIQSVANLDYDLIAYPNAENQNINPSAMDKYRLLKRPDGDDVSTDWTDFAQSSDPCVVSTNYFETVGTGFNGFSKFAITSGDDPNNMDNDGDGFSVNDGDCDDDDADTFPGAPELCDGLDNDCDGVIPADETDDDGDGFFACEDCDDNDENTFPGAPELCDGIDNDCDGVIPADEVDADNDSFFACEDCNDNDAEVFPGAPEQCNGMDDNCDLTIPADELDNDSDGFLACEECNDNDPDVFPGAPEVCDGIDNNCDGQIDENACNSVDNDGDGFTVADGDCDDDDPLINPNAVEECDGVDNNCDGQIDEGTNGATYVGNKTFSTQAQVDDFLPCYGIIDGQLLITGSNIDDLSALSGLTEVTGNLVIQQTSVIDLTGLDNITEIGGRLDISSNTKLENLSGLGALTDIGDRFFIFGNNVNLTTLEGLDNLDNIGGGLLLFFNNFLTDCCPVEPLIPNGIGGSVVVFGNGSGCQSVPAIQAACNPPFPFDDSGGEFFDYEKLIIDVSSDVLIFPNPATDYLEVIIGREFSIGRLNLVNSQGQTVFKTSLNQSDKNSIDLPELSPGLYSIILEIDGNVTSKKIILK